MKLTEQQIWQCNNTEDGGVHICLDHQNVVDFARAIEREIGFTKAELWIKRINDAVEAEREACAKVCDNMTEDEAVEYIEYNIQAAYVGNSTPIIVWPFDESKL